VIFLTGKELRLSGIFQRDGKVGVFAFCRNIFSSENPQNTVENLVKIVHTKSN
jgi:DhnA family fructose-bisphosphate aldolase class Ia